MKISTLPLVLFELNRFNFQHWLNIQTYSRNGGKEKREQYITSYSQDHKTRPTETTQTQTD